MQGCSRCILKPQPTGPKQFMGGSVKWQPPTKKKKHSNLCAGHIFKITIQYLFTCNPTFIIIMSGHEHRFPWLSLSLAIHLSHLLPLAGPLDNILCLYRAVVDKFQLVIQHMLVHVMGSKGEDYLSVLPYSSHSVPYILLLWFGMF